MSVKTPSRYARSRSPSRSDTPLRRTPGGSPPGSASGYSSTLNGLLSPKLNIVTRVAIEGKARKDKDSVAIKMYLKMSVPVDSVEPGTTIPLFPEDNIKVVSSQVHPLDQTSAPYHFSSAAAPLLHNAARALSLPSRLSRTFSDAFELTPGVGASSSRASSKSGSSTNSSDSSGIVEDKYTGHILVSGYQVSYVVPKYFPSQFVDVPISSRIAFGSNRRQSIGERNHVHFMAAIDMLVPYVSRPPRAPFLLSIPTPKCLHNNIKLRIFPPRDGSSSSASLSDDDAGSWDLTADPHVSRAAARTHGQRTHSIQNFADDESSDSSTAGFSEGIGIQGTFPSAERIRVRWAKPKRPINSDGRGRVGVREVKGDMTCTVRGKMRDASGVEGIIMDVDYKGTCKGVWFDGVATLLGMEVGLIAKGSEVSWVAGSAMGWDVTGGNGYTGFDSGLLPASSSRAPGERHDSFDSSSPLAAAFPYREMSRTPSTSSTSSLLRVPLPTQQMGDYSFEGSSSVANSMSSVGGLSQSETAQPLDLVAPPGQPITIHVNMNELLPPAHNVFTFSIAGTILVVPKPTRRPSATPLPSAPFPSTSTSSSTPLDPNTSTTTDPEPLVLPDFTVFVVDTSTSATVVRNEAAGASVEVYNSIGDFRRDPQVRKTVLQRGAHTKCGAEGGRIAFRSTAPPNNNTSTSAGQSQGVVRARTISGSKGRRGLGLGGPALIPYVCAVVTPLTTGGGGGSGSAGGGGGGGGSAGGGVGAYAVRVTLPCTGAELEFGLGYPDQARGEGGAGEPRVEIASVSVDGVPVRYETTAAAAAGVKQEGGEGEGGGGGGGGVGEVKFEQMSGKEWISWVKVLGVGVGGGGMVVIDYVVQEGDASGQGKGQGKGKGKSKGKGKGREVQFDVFLPTFALPLGKLEVVVDDNPGLAIRTEKTNLSFSGPGGHLMQFAIPAFFYPHLTLSMSVSQNHNHTWNQNHNQSHTRNQSWNQSQSRGRLEYATLVVLVLVLGMMGMVYRRLPSGGGGVGGGIDMGEGGGYFLDGGQLFLGDGGGGGVGRGEMPAWGWPTWWTKAHAEPEATPFMPTIPQPEATDYLELEVEEEVEVDDHVRPKEKEKEKEKEEWSPSSSSSSPSVYRAPESLQRLMNMNLHMSVSWEDIDFAPVKSTLRSVWEILRRVYHYPLPPP